MDHPPHDSSEKEGPERRNSNTEYLPTKCRITKPPPPKPATNPLQFIKVAPCPLFEKAKEQIKKVEEIKTVRQEVRDEAEDWQQNLDNWKSSRRKRQEHIIERVVEVKKLEQEEQGRGRRKSKTFSEMMEERTKRGHRLNIPIYDDDSNDLSDYGIGSSSSKTNSIKDVDTDDSSSILDEKEHAMNMHSVKDASSASNQSQSEEDELSSNAGEPERCRPTIVASVVVAKPTVAAKPRPKSLLEDVGDAAELRTEPPPQYTYEGAIQDYRSRIQSKIHVDESIFTKQSEPTNNGHHVSVGARTTLAQVDVFKRKELFEVEKPLEIRHYETSTSRRLSEDFANTRSIKDRLKSLERCTDQPIKSIDKNGSTFGSVRSKIHTFNRSVSDAQNNNNSEQTKQTPDAPTTPTKTISSYLLDTANNGNSRGKANGEWSSGREAASDRCSSPEAEIYMNKLNMFNRDLDAFLGNAKGAFATATDNNYGSESNYPASLSSTDLAGGLSSDREDSGIHTADVSCAVSQADEPIEEGDLLLLSATTTIPNCIEKLTGEKSGGDSSSSVDNKSDASDGTDDSSSSLNGNSELSSHTSGSFADNAHACTRTQTGEFLRNAREDANDNCAPARQYAKLPIAAIVNVVEKTEAPPTTETRPIVYENFTPLTYGIDELLTSASFPLAPPKTIEPPKEKPPPPPPPDDDDEEEVVAKPKTMKRLSSTKRIKKEIQLKRSSFLGLDGPLDDHIDPDLSIGKPPDISSFLKRESQLEKNFYKKLQGSRDMLLSEVESQDSGLECERGRLSSDTWCSSVGDYSIPSHGRQDSENTNSVTSEEDEIAKKEREIIEMVEKDEKSRDSDYSPPTKTNGSLNRSCYPKAADDRDSEVLKVEHELLQLEREEQERKRECANYREIRAKLYRTQNPQSLENICDRPYHAATVGNGHRKSMPELQHNYRPSDTRDLYANTMHEDVHYRKSMPDIQQAYLRSIPDCRKPLSIHLPVEYRKSLPDLQQDVKISAFHVAQVARPPPIMAGIPIRPLAKDQQRTKERFLMMSAMESDQLHYQNGKGARPIGRPGLHALSAVPKPRHIPNDNWIQPKANMDNKKNYNQHWLYQEAELRRIADQQKNTSNRNWPGSRQEKHIPEPIIQTLTQRVQNRAIQNERNQVFRRQEISPKTELNQIPFFHPRTIGHALPVSYPSPANLEESQGKMLSVSGKKKCSHCGIELGRGAAMIIESLRLFYHIECFKCIVCHVQLGDGLMGIDVRVRNHKLHCHNCYSSDDGVKLSCV